MNSRSVNHPQHYGGDTPYEAIKVIEAWNLGFCLGNAVKYISRAGKKDPAKAIEDLEKARWYLDREIATLKAKKPPIHYRGTMGQVEAIPCGIAQPVLDGLWAWLECSAGGHEYPVMLTNYAGNKFEGFIVDPTPHMNNPESEIQLGASKKGVTISQGKWKLGDLKSIDLVSK